MILKMEKLSVFGLLRDKQSVVSELMKASCVQITAPETMGDYEEIRELTDACTPDVYEQEVLLSRYTAALSGISYFSKKPGLFAQRPRVLYDNLENGEIMDRAKNLCGEIERITGEISDLRGAKSKDAFLRTSLEPWLESDLPLEESATAQVNITHYLLPVKTDMQELSDRLDQEAPASHLQVVSQDREQQYVLAFCHKDLEQQFWNVLKDYGANRASFPGLRGAAGENIQELDKRIMDTDAAIFQLEDQLRTLGEDIYPLKYAYDVLSVRIQRERVQDNFLATEKSFCFTAWLPETAKEDALAILEQYGCYYQLSEPSDDEEPPVLLKNSKLVTPYETVTEMYSLPAYRGIDPNFFVSIFYFIFFGMMLSDAGFGLVLFIGGLIMGKKMDLGPGAKKLVSVITMGGLSAVIWGAIFGSWFGDVIPVIADVYFGKEVVVPQLLDPISQAVIVMALSMVLGLIHIFVGMGLKAYLLVKRGHPWEALFDVGFWIMVLLGLTMMLGAMILLSTESVLFLIGAVMAIMGAVGLILTQGRDKKNPFMKLASGVMSLYDITGFLSDVLSYSRILALGLATGVIAQVFNIMGTMPGANIIGAIVFLLVFAAGSALNLGINTLGAYVHTARLQYVEFFGKFYEAGGRPFSPVTPKTKYIVVTNKEEI